MAEVARGARATVKTAAVPFPIASEQQVIDNVLAQITERTRFCLLDHISSPTGLILPVQRLISEIRRRNANTVIMIDGAHAPAQLALDLDTLDADFYTGNGHKWIGAAPGSAFLHVPRRHQDWVRPTVISHFADVDPPDRFQAEFGWTGTADPIPYLTIPVAIQTLERALPSGLDQLRERNHGLVRAARDLILRIDGIDATLPAPDSMIGWMATIPLPDTPRDDYFTRTRSGMVESPLSNALRDRFGIVAAVNPWGGGRSRNLRLSAHLYNSLDQYKRLADALAQLLGEE